MSQYFTQETDKYICLFNMADTDSEKHNIFNANIRPAFEKLIENLIFVYSYYAIDDVDTLKRECLSTLYEMLPKYNTEFGSKGFSYFNVVAKNWFIHRIREKNKRNKIESELYCDVDNDIAKNEISEMIINFFIV